MKMMLRKTCSALILLCLLPVSALGIEQAELVFTNGKLYTVNDKQPWAEAVAVTGKNIVFVGSNAEAKKIYRFSATHC